MQGTDLKVGNESLWNKTFIAISIINLIMFTGFQMLHTTFALYVEQIGGDEAVAGLIAALFSIASVMIRPFMGWLLDRNGRRIILILTLIGMAIVTIVYPFINIIIVAAILRIFHGLSWSGASTASNTVACDIIPPARFGQAMALFATGPALSMAIGPFLGLALWNGGGANIMFWFSAACTIASLVMTMIIFPPSLEPKRDISSAPRAKGIEGFIDRHALPPSVALCLFTMPYGGIATFIALYSQETGICSGGMFFAMLSATTVLTRIFFGRMADQKKTDLLVIISYISLLIALPLLAFGNSSATFIISALIYGVGFGIMSPTMQSIAMRLAPPERRGVASSTFLCSFDVGMGIGSAIAGFMIKSAGYSFMYSVMTLFVVASLILYLTWVRRLPAF